LEFACKSTKHTDTLQSRRNKITFIRLRVLSTTAQVPIQRSRVQEFYINTTHQQYIQSTNSIFQTVPVLHTPVILRSISNGLTTTFISNRAPNYFSDSNPLKVYPLTQRRRNILQATRQYLNNSIGLTRARIGLVGTSHGAHTHFEPYLEAEVPWIRRNPPPSQGCSIN
jgi:hypothetical protein